MMADRQGYPVAGRGPVTPSAYLRGFWLLFDYERGDRLEPKPYNQNYSPLGLFGSCSTCENIPARVVLGAFTNLSAEIIEGVPSALSMAPM